MQPQNVNYQVTLPDKIDTTTVADDLPKWLIDHAAGCSYLLAHTLSGIVWGRFEQGTLKTSHDVFPKRLPPLRPETLQQCFIFGKNTEVLLWRDDTGWKARRITDHQVLLVKETTALENALDEAQMLWGTASEQQQDSFTLVCDGMEGLCHAVPLDVPAAAFQPAQNQAVVRPLRLLVRHYTADNDDGVAHICLSRLVDVYVASHQNEEDLS